MWRNINIGIYDVTLSEYNFRFKTFEFASKQLRFKLSACKLNTL